VKIPNWAKWALIIVAVYWIATDPVGAADFISSSAHNIGAFFRSIHF